MPRVPLLTALFLASYAPMFLLVSVRSWDTSHVVAWVCVGLALLGIAGIVAFLCTAKSLGATPVKVVQVERRDADVASYAATYLLPFVTVFNGNTTDVISLVGFIAVLGVVYVRSRLIYINPLLSIIGYDLYRVTATAANAEASSPGAVGWPRYLLAHRTAVHVGDIIKVREPTPDMYLYTGHRAS